MNMKSKTMASCLLLILPAFAIAEVNTEVQEAMDYQLPKNTCSKPRAVEGETSASPPAARQAGTAEFFVGSSDADVSDMDTYTRKRLENKKRRWQKCVSEYKAGLLDDMETLKASAAHGITREQADIILANLASIQKVYMTPEGVLTE